MRAEMMNVKETINMNNNNLMMNDDKINKENTKENWRPVRSASPAFLPYCAPLFVLHITHTTHQPRHVSRDALCVCVCRAMAGLRLAQRRCG